METTEEGELKKRLSFVWKQLQDVPFYPHRVTSSFCTSSLFSSLDFRLAVYGDGTHNKVAYRASNLFKEVEEVAGHEEAIRFIIRSRQHCWPPICLDQKLFGKLNKRLMFLQVCSQILVPLSLPNEVFLETGYRCFIDGQYAALNCANLGMGTNDVWHGIPDARVRGAEVQRWSDEPDEVNEPNDEDNDGDGATTTVEGIPPL